MKWQADDIMTQQLEADQFSGVIDPQRYPTLAMYVDEVRDPVAEIIGRDAERDMLLASLARPELANAMLLAPAGVGKTALVQSVKAADPERIYLEVDLARMISDLDWPSQMAARLKEFFDEAELYSRNEDEQIVLFIDEFHQIVQLSVSAVEALKPVLAASGTRGLLIIGATTQEEFHEHIAPNQPLRERLQTIQLSPPDTKTTVAILRGRAELHGVADQFTDDGLFTEIVELTNRFIPRSVQPRQSILVLDSMIGWHRFDGRPMSMKLVAQVLRDSTGIDIGFKVDGPSLKANLDKAVFSQVYATKIVADRLQLVAADLHDKSRPAGSFIFAGPTGVGKMCSDDTPVPVATVDGSRWKRHGDLVVGDKVFDVDGNPTEVTGVYPQGVKDLYRVHFWDGRHLDVGAEHLWGVYTSKMRSNKHAGKNVSPVVMSTQDMLDAGVVRSYLGDDRRHVKFFVPAGGPVQWAPTHLPVDPYVYGVLLARGWVDDGKVMLDVDDELREYIAEYVGVSASDGESKNQIGELEVFPRELQDVLTVDRRQRLLDECYLTGAVDDRRLLVRGLFDADGRIDNSNNRLNINFSTFNEQLATQVSGVLFGLGLSNTVRSYVRKRAGNMASTEFLVAVKATSEDKLELFTTSAKRSVVENACLRQADRSRVKRFDMVGISDIEKIDSGSASCIMVADSRHLYQAGEGFIVTHNTELTKQLGKLLFGDDTGRLVRFDMSEFANASSLELFRSELTRRVSAMGRAIVLLDEIEKAHKVVYRLLLQVLDDGRLTDDYNRQVSFLNCYFVMTTNAGRDVYRTIADYAADDTGSGELMREFDPVIYKALVNNGFPPELLGRVDEVVPFQPLSIETKRKVLQSQLAKLRDDVHSKHGVTLRIDPAVLRYLSQDLVKTDTESGGAREAVRTLRREITTKVAVHLNAHPDNKILQVYIKGEMRDENKHRLKSGAVPMVTAVRR